MRKKLKVNQKTEKYLDSLPKVYVLMLWAKWTYEAFPFSGKMKKINGELIPLVYQYNDHNGEYEAYHLKPAHMTSSGAAKIFSMDEGTMKTIVEKLNKEE